MKSLKDHRALLEHLPNHTAAPLFPEGEEQRCAIVMAHFGTTDKVAREQAIEPLNELARQSFPGVEVREVYTSRIIMKRLKDRGTTREDLPTALQHLSEQGFTRILVQPSVIIDGVEMESIRRDVKAHSHLFEEIRVSTPLLYHPLDYFALAEHLRRDFEGVIAYVGHGTYDSSTAQYALLQQVLQRKGLKHILISTIEGYPDLEDLVAQMEERAELRRLHGKSLAGKEPILLVPLMFVAGIHAKEDIAGDWMEDLTEAGYPTTADLTGLGELPAVRQLYINKMDFAIHYRAWDIMKKKKIYTQTGEKID